MTGAPWMARLLLCGFCAVCHARPRAAFRTRAPRPSAAAPDSSLSAALAPWWDSIGQWWTVGAPTASAGTGAGAAGTAPLPAGLWPHQLDAGNAGQVPPPPPMPVARPTPAPAPPGAREQTPVDWLSSAPWVDAARGPGPGPRIWSLLPGGIVGLLHSMLELLRSLGRSAVGLLRSCVDLAQLSTTGELYSSLRSGLQVCGKLLLLGSSLLLGQRLGRWSAYVDPHYHTFRTGDIVWVRDVGHAAAPGQEHRAKRWMRGQVVGACRSSHGSSAGSGSAPSSMPVFSHTWHAERPLVRPDGWEHAHRFAITSATRPWLVWLLGEQRQREWVRRLQEGEHGEQTGRARSPAPTDRTAPAPN
jgi:hypothetical protein